MSARPIDFIRDTRSPGPIAATYVVLATVALFSFALGVHHSGASFSSLVKLRRLKLQTVPVSQTFAQLEKPPAVETLLTFSTDRIFQSGSATLLPAAAADLQRVIARIRTETPHARIEIEGHTDSRPVIHHRLDYPTNWEMSAARAAAVLHLFEQAGFARDRLKLTAFADTRPLASAEAGSANLRLIVRIGGAP